MSQFILTDEKWIPCVMDNGTAHDLSLRESLNEAHHIREIFDPSPLVTAALHRLLLAVLHRNFRVNSLADWKMLWQQRRFDEEKLNTYFDRWWSRFDLLHAERPFYQRSSLTLSKRMPLKRLGWEFAAGNNGTLFDHSWDEDRPAVAPAVAARWVIATQCFAASAGRGEKGQLHTKDSPWTRGAIILVQGDNLFETLALNLLSLHRTDFLSTQDDLPVWESDEDWQPAHDQTPRGLLEYLTWQSRSIRLLPDEQGALRECFFAQGRALPEDFRNEPMYAYRRNREQGLIIWSFNEFRVLWRDSHALFNLSDEAPFRVPQAFHQLARLVREGFLERERMYRLQVMGQCLESGQPTIYFWRTERLPLRVEYLNEKELLEKLREALTLTEQVARDLGASVYMLARLLLEYTSERKPDKKDIQQIIMHLGTEALYWSRLEGYFRKLLSRLPNDQTTDEGGVVEYGTTELPRWEETLRAVATDTFTTATRSLDNSSRALKAVAAAEHNFRRRLNETLGISQSQSATGGQQ